MFLKKKVYCFVCTDMNSIVLDISFCYYFLSLSVMLIRFVRVSGQMPSCCFKHRTEYPPAFYFSGDAPCWRDPGTLRHGWQGGKVIWPFQTTVWQYIWSHSSPPSCDVGTYHGEICSLQCCWRNPRAGDSQLCAGNRYVRFTMAKC